MTTKNIVCTFCQYGLSTLVFPFYKNRINSTYLAEFTMLEV